MSACKFEYKAILKTEIYQKIPNHYAPEGNEKKKIPSDENFHTTGIKT